MDWIDVKVELPEEGTITRYKAEIWRNGCMKCVETGKAEYLRMDKIISKPIWDIDLDSDDWYTNVTHWKK